VTVDYLQHGAFWPQRLAPRFDARRSLPNFSPTIRATEAAETERVGDDRDRREGHSAGCDHRVEYADGGQRYGGGVVGERPEEVLSNGA
jgi:hypothetical protein